MMRELTYVDSPYPDAELTTEHAASSYGQPVLVIGEDRKAYGPGDVLPNGMNAREWVRLAHSHREDECRDAGPLPKPW